MENAITVSALRNDPRSFGVPKYDNRATWNHPFGVAPNGVSAYRWLRKTNPKLDDLKPLARWLVEHVPSCVAGLMPHNKYEARVRVYNGRSEAEQLRIDYPDGYDRHGVPVENIIRAYDLDSQPCCIDDWLFDQIMPSETDEDYWNRQAEKMIRAGATRVQIGNNVWEKQATA